MQQSANREPRRGILRYMLIGNRYTSVVSAAARSVFIVFLFSPTIRVPFFAAGHREALDAR